MTDDTAALMTFKGNWPDELWETHGPDPLIPEGWETFSVRLWGAEAGDYITTPDQVAQVLRRAGLRLVKSETFDALSARVAELEAENSDLQTRLKRISEHAHKLGVCHEWMIEFCTTMTIGPFPSDIESPEESIRWIQQQAKNFLGLDEA